MIVTRTEQVYIYVYGQERVRIFSKIPERERQERDHDVMFNEKERKGERYVQAGRRNNL